ncbi:DUF1403 family protein [Methylosinus sp. LW4]|uniref:DUF1403 family protein n=1 Tax=Methylosinus sp. LW4 TaxID=136993 RepID=UPI0012F7E8F4
MRKADIVFAERLKWAAPLPLAMIGGVDPTLRHGSKGRLPRPGKPDWPTRGARRERLGMTRKSG